MILKLIKKIITIKTFYRFKKKSNLGKNIQFLPSSKCINSGAKNNIKLGNNGCCFCYLQALYGGKITIGNNFYIGSGTVIQSKQNITIGDNVIISNNVLIVDNNNHPVEPQKRLEMSLCDDYMTDSLWTWETAASKPICIENNTWIGRDSVIMKGVRIGEGAIVGLRSVVTKDVPPYTVVAGNPAKVVKILKQEKNNEKN